MPPRKNNPAVAIARKLPPAVPAPYPGFIEPARPNLQRKAPSGERWTHEIKWDGYRMQVHLVDGAARIFTRGRQ
jgi:bifunctional non-homologous end joining protein LigD